LTLLVLGAVQREKLHHIGYALSETSATF
jgi:hypothetical protein